MAREANSTKHKAQNAYIETLVRNMHILLCQLYGQTIRFLRGDRSIQIVATTGEIPLVTWRRWEKGQQLPNPSQVPKIVRGLGCTNDQFELAFLATARTELGKRKTQQLRLVSSLIPDFADLATGFEESMTLQQVTLEAFEALAVTFGLLERLTDAEPLDSANRRIGNSQHLTIPPLY